MHLTKHALRTPVCALRAHNDWCRRRITLQLHRSEWGTAEGANLPLGGGVCRVVQLTSEVDVGGFNQRHIRGEVCNAAVECAIASGENHFVDFRGWVDIERPGD